MSTRYETANSLTREYRRALGMGSVEYSPAGQEYVIWPEGRAYRYARDVRRYIREQARKSR